MIVTLTANPSVDQTITLTEPLSAGSVHVATHVRSQSGGKGVNICRAAQLAGVESLAVFPSPSAHSYLHDLLALGLSCRTVEVDWEIRTNVTVTEPDGTTTKLNSPGTHIPMDALAQLRAIVLDAISPGDWMVCAGSLPPSVDPASYALLCAQARERGALVAVDTSGPPLAALMGALPEAAPDLLKPNGDELASITGVAADQLETDPQLVAKAARELLDRGVGTVLATLGGLGAVLTTRGGSWHATPPPASVISTVGAGDSSLFGYLWGHQQALSEPERLALAVAYGTAAASLPGTDLPRPDQTHPELVEVVQL